MLNNLARITLVAAVAAGTMVVAPAQADAATSVKCQIVNSTTVGGFNWRKMPTKRVCQDNLPYGVSGQAQLTRKTIVIHYSKGKSTTNAQVAKATVHELAHHVEYRTTPAHRAKLHAFVGLRNPSGNYFAVNDKYYYSGSLALWKASPRERIAESVVNCTYGTPNHTGMKLVPKSKCGAFLTEFRASLADAK